MKGPTSTQSALQLLDSIVALPREDALGTALRKQAALVRALLDELQRRTPGDRWFVDLSTQLEDEVGRLAQLLVDERRNPRDALS